MRKKVLATVLCLLTPSVLPVIFVVSVSKQIMRSENVKILYAISILLAAFGFYIFYRRRPCSPWIIPVGFILSGLSCFIYERTIVSSLWFKQLVAMPDPNLGTAIRTVLGTALVTIYYSAPFTIAALIFAAVLTIRKKRQNTPDQE